MLPSQYHYIKRMWTRNYPRRGPGILSRIFWFPLKLVAFIIIAGIMISFYVIAIAVWILLVFIWELLKAFFKLFKFIIIKLFKTIKNKKENKIDTVFNIIQELDDSKELADIINTTCDFSIFVHSFNEITKKLELLSDYEKSNIFSGSTPSADLKRIIENKTFTEKDFIDRYVETHGIDSLYSKRHYLHYFNVDSISYFNSILEKSN